MITKEIKPKLKENLKKLYKIIIKNNDKPYDRNKLWKSSINYKNKTTLKFFSSSEVRCFEDFIDILFNILKIKENFSREYFDVKLDNILHKLIKIEEEIDKVIEKEIETLKKEISKDLEQKWQIIFPLENIRITDENMKNIDTSFLLGNSKIYKFNKTSKKEIENKAETKLIFTKHDNLMGKICINIEVNGGDVTKAIEKGYHSLDEILNILRLFNPWIKIDAEGQISRNVSWIRIINLERKGITTASFRGGEIITNNNAIYEPYYTTLLKNGLSDINHIYSKQERNDFEIKLLDSIHWFGSAVKDKYDRDKFIKLTICLETLLKKDGDKEEITKTISERLALLVGQHFDERKEILSDMKKLYGIRSAIVHRGKRNVEQTLLNRLIFLVHDAIRNALYRYGENKENYSFNIFIDDLDDLKMKLPKKEQKR